MLRLWPGAGGRPEQCMKESPQPGISASRHTEPALIRCAVGWSLRSSLLFRAVKPSEPAQAPARAISRRQAGTAMPGPLHSVLPETPAQECTRKGACGAVAATGRSGGARWRRHDCGKVRNCVKKDLTSNECFDSAIMSRAEPSRAEPSRAEPSRAEPSRAEPSRAEPSRAEPSRAERAEPSRAEPSRAEPSRAEPSRAEPSRANNRLSGTA